MKTNKIFLFLVLIVSFLLISNNVFATEGEETIEKADFSEASFNVVSNGNFYSLEVSNITLPTKSDGKPVEMNVRYTIGNREPEFSSKYGESYSGTYNAETKKLVFSRAETALQLSGDVYFWIFQVDYTALGAKKTGSLVYSAQLERTVDKKFSELIKPTVLNSSLTYISINTPMENYLKRKAQFRIGEITDNSILKAIKNNDTANGLNKLLSYAKTSTAIYDGILKGSPNFAANLNDGLQERVKNDAYYFIYVEFDDEEGKYYPVEGVTVGLGLASTTQSWNIVFYGNSQFNWDSLKEPELPDKPTDDPKEEDKEEVEKPSDDEIKDDQTDNNEDKNEEKDKTTAETPLPNAGEKTMILGLIIILILSSIILYCLNRKYSFIK